MWVHSNPLMSHAGVTFISPPVVTPPPVAKSVSFTGYITMLWVRPLEMCLDPYKNWIQVDPVFEFLKLLLCCDVALSSPIVTRHSKGAFELSLFDFSRSFVFLKRWPYWPLQKKETPRNSTTSSGERGGLVPKSLE